jgi:hypothetical protein
MAILKGGWLAPAAAAILGLSAPAAGAARLAGVTLPDTTTLGGTQLHLNGIALRTYSWLRIHIYVAGLYVEHPSHDAAAILDSSEDKLLVFRFVHDVDASHARDAWRDGFEQNCRPPCRLAPADVRRFLSVVPPIRAGDLSTLAFTPGGLTIMLNGLTVGTITDPVFSRAVLLTLLGPNPPSALLKRELLGG